MKKYTIKQGEKWLVNRNLKTPNEDNYKYKKVFRLGIVNYRIICLIRNIVNQIEGYKESLIKFEDWPLYKEDQMYIMNELRKSNSRRSNWIINKPYLLLNENQKIVLVSILSLTQEYQWTLNVYFDKLKLCLEFWEGEYMDVYSDYEESILYIENIMKIIV